jgi:hypothetical protein
LVRGRQMRHGAGAVDRQGALHKVVTNKF